MFNDNNERTRRQDSPDTRINNATEPLVDPHSTQTGAPVPPAPATRVNMPPVQAQRYGYENSVPRVRRKQSRRQAVMGGCLAIGGAFLAFGLVALVVAVILIPPVYRAQRPEIQEIWCNRAERVMLGDAICSLKPTIPFTALPSFGTVAPSDLDALLNPPTPTPGGDSGASGSAPVAETPAPPTPLPAATESGGLPTPTVTPSLAPTLAPTATPSPTVTPFPLPVSTRLDVDRLTYHAQTWNNCGPATLSMSLSYYGYTNNQSVAARFLKPNREDKNVSPYQMVNYVNESASQQLPVRAIYRVGGTLDTLKRLLANGFPVIIEKGYEPEGYEWMGHYLLLIGYDDTEGVFYTYDSFLGHGNLQGLRESYADVENYWRHFNNLFIVPYETARQAELTALLGELADPLSAAQVALNHAREQANQRPDDAWAWFNLGSAYTMLGQYEQAAQAFDQAFFVGMPWRTLWYLHYPYVAYFAVGRYDDLLAHSNATERTTPYVEETFYYRGAVLAARGDVQGAVAQFSAALTYNSNFAPARTAREAVQNGTFTPEMVVQMGLGG